MALFMRSLRKPCISSFSSFSSSPSSLKTLVPSAQLQLEQDASLLLSQFQTRAASHAAQIIRSPFDSNILRILRNEIQYQNYAPPQEYPTMFNSFTVQDRPGEQWMRLNSKFGENEDIKIDVTMFDGCIMVPKPGEDNDGEDMRLHLSMLVNLFKGDNRDEAMEIVCSAWPDCLVIQKVYMLRQDQLLRVPYMGPDFRNLDDKVQCALREFLEERGINNELSVFLHEYMMNKDRVELIRWLGTVQSFLEKS